MATTTIGTGRATRTGAGPGVKFFYGVCGTAVVAYTILLFTRGNGVGWTWLDGWGVASFEALMSVMIIARAFVSRKNSRYCLFLGLGGLSWALGDFAMTIETLHGATPATLSPANLLWYGFFPLAYLGVMMLMQRDVQKLTSANYLDGVVAALVTFTVLAAFVFHWLVNTAGGGTATVVVNLIYPVGDLLLFGLTVIGVS